MRFAIPGWLLHLTVEFQYTGCARKVEMHEDHDMG